MKAKINHHLFTQVNLDSGAITCAASIVHNFAQLGTYSGSVMRADQRETEFHLVVTKESKNMQVDIDLSEVGRAASATDKCACNNELQADRHFEVNPEGYVVFYVSQGPGGYSVSVTGKADDENTVQFDSTQLRYGDLFIVSLLRPGLFSLTNTNGAKGDLVVAYPRRGGEANLKNMQPVEIRCLEKEFVPPKVELQVVQGQIYRIETKEGSRIKIDLQRADDGPKREPEKVFQWRKPGRAKQATPDKNTNPVKDPGLTKGGKKSD
ncbi:MAG TPA: hypothetical protein VJV03_09035 [Pyrinomonadaceae bacterium]|nr:hypothetical protein [Pyrinomonadaceae bacterium]